MFQFPGKYTHIAVAQNMFEVKKQSKKRKISFGSGVTGVKPKTVQIQTDVLCLSCVRKLGGVCYRLLQ